MERRKYVAGLLIAISLGLCVVFAVRIEEGGAKKSPPGHVSSIAAASYIVYSDGVYVHAKNGDTGIVDYSGKDASEVIQAAIDSLGSCGGSVLIREGTYVISTTIRVPGNVTLCGVGFATRLLLADYADQCVIENRHPESDIDSDIVIRDLQIDGNGAKQSDEPTVSASAIFFTRVTECRVEGCWIHNVSPVKNLNSGITTVLSSKIVIRGNVIYDNGYSGVFLSSDQGSIVSENTFMRNHRGVYLAGHSNAIVEGNQIISNDEGIRMYQVASNNIIQGNLIRDSNEQGIKIHHPECENNFVVNNYLIRNYVQISDKGTGTQIKNNIGYRTENYGVANVKNGSFVSHGLVSTPTSVQLTPTAQRLVSVISRNSTHIQIGLWFLDGTAVTNPEDVHWCCEL